eukprot:g29905.t1
MVANDPMDVGGMADEDKGDPIAVVGGKKGVEDRSVGDGSDPAEGPVNYGVGESSVEEEHDISSIRLLKLASSQQMQRRRKNW